MAQLLLIAEKSLSTKDDRQVGDVVGVFDDTDVFSEKEREIFDVEMVSGDKETLNATLSSIQTTAHRAKTTDWSLDLPEEKQVWKDDTGNWREIVEKPRFPYRLENGALKENYSRISANTENIIVPAKLDVKG